MAWYPYSYKTAFDPISGEKAPAGSVGEVYAVGDTGFTTPLETFDLSGLPVALEVQGEVGYVPSFQVEDNASVVWKSGDYIFEMVTSMPLPGPQGSNVVGAVDNGDGTVTFSLSNGESVGPVGLPEGPEGPRGPAGYNATGAVEDQQALADYVNETAGTNPFSGALSATYAPLSFAGGVYLKVNGGWTIGLGDSLTDDDAKQRSYFEAACVLSDQQIAHFGNAGVSGNTVQQMLARLDTDVITKRPERALFMAGTNNMNNDLTAAWDSYTEILDRLTVAGIAVALVSIPPQTAVQTIRDNIALWNSWISDEATRRGMPYVNIHDALSDGAGNYQPEYTTDNLHMTQAGAETAARIVVDALSGIWPESPVKLFTAADPASLVSNPTFVDANADGTPDDWVVAGSGTVGSSSITADPAVDGNVARLTRTAASGTLAYTRSVTTGLSPGDTLEFAVKFRANSDAVEYSFYATASDPNYVLLHNEEVLVAWTADLGGFHVAYGRMTLPTGTTRAEIVLHTSAGLGTVDWGQVTFRKI